MRGRRSPELRGWLELIDGDVTVSRHTHVRAGKPDDSVDLVIGAPPHNLELRVRVNDLDGLITSLVEARDWLRAGPGGDVG